MRRLSDLLVNFLHREGLWLVASPLRVAGYRSKFHTVQRRERSANKPAHVVRVSVRPQQLSCTI